MEKSNINKHIGNKFQEYRLKKGSAKFDFFKFLFLALKA